MSTREFKFGDVFPPEDDLSTWACGLALAFNDLVFAHRKMEETDGWEFFYWWRVGVGHYTEALLHLERSKDIAAVREFIDALPGDVRSYYEEALGSFDQNRALAMRVRNEAAFHYPYAGGRDAMIKALADLTETDTELKLGGKLSDARLDFADELMATMVMNASGGEDKVEAAQALLGESVAALMRFTNNALDILLSQRVEAAESSAS